MSCEMAKMKQPFCAESPTEPECSKTLWFFFAFINCGPCSANVCFVNHFNFSSFLISNNASEGGMHCATLNRSIVCTHDDHNLIQQLQREGATTCSSASFLSNTCQSFYFWHTLLCYTKIRHDINCLQMISWTSTFIVWMELLDSFITLTALAVWQFDELMFNSSTAWQLHEFVPSHFDML